MLLIFSEIFSSRLQYCCNFIFKELIGVDFAITIDSEAFKNYQGICINYSSTVIKDKEYHLVNSNLLFEVEVKEQVVTCFETNGYKAFLKINNSDFKFDIFAATFYLLSRYEEYLPHTKDNYGRYAHQNSLAFKEDFLQLPLINIWVQDFILSLQKKYAVLNTQFKPELSQKAMFKFIPTYDIDMAFSYKHKSFLRNAGGFFKSPSLERIKVLLGLQKDPFDSFDWLNKLHQQNKLRPIYFFLVAEKNGQFDKNILPHKNVMWKLVKQHAKKYTIGIHPSWQSGDTTSLLKKESTYLAAMCEREITASRQHYIRFNLPEGYQTLIEAGITDDYSMGYGSINGFRASVATSFFWYDLHNEKQTDLRIHPFCFMDTNSFYEQNFSATQAYEELMHYYGICKSSNSTLITIWHNNFLGTAAEFKEWATVYKQFVEMASD